MALSINSSLQPTDLIKPIERVFELSAQKILNLEKTWNPADGTPVFTIDGKYTTRGWTEWTQGFQFGAAILQFDVTGDPQFLELGRKKTIELMASHVSHIGVHDHGFNNVSTYGNLLRLLLEGRIEANAAERDFYELALKVSGAIQAARWTQIADGTGFVHSFNGPHSLFIDTIRSMRSLSVAHKLGHSLMSDHDERINLLHRALDHAVNTAKFSVYYGEGRDAYDVWGRSAHESVFNTNDGFYRCPNSQQGFSPFTTWTRGLAWAIAGFPEQLEFLETIDDSEIAEHTNPEELRACFLKAARATSDFYIDNSCLDGVPLWDTGALNVHKLGGYLDKPSDPYNDWEPFDGSAAAIAAQGMIRLGRYLSAKGDTTSGQRYYQAGLNVAKTLFEEPYLSTDTNHQGLLLHSIYHRPNGWDQIHDGQKIPNDESAMWGDYHLRELAALIYRMAKDQPYLTFFGCIEN